MTQTIAFLEAPFRRAFAVTAFGRLQFRVLNGMYRLPAACIRVSTSIRQRAMFFRRWIMGENRGNLIIPRC